MFPKLPRLIALFIILAAAAAAPSVTPLPWNTKTIRDKHPTTRHSFWSSIPTQVHSLLPGGHRAITWQRGNRRYTVTNRRVVLEFGRWSKDTQEIRIQDIRSMNVSKNGMSGLLGIGKVKFSSAATDDADVIFYQVGGADGVRDLVRKLQS